MLKMITAILTLTLCVFTNTAHSTALSQDQSSVVILAYHRIGQDDHPKTNLRQAQFDAHIKELTNGNYNIIPISKAINAFEGKTSLPPRSIVITFEGAYKSAYENAMKKLAAKDIPFTVIYAADRAKQGGSQYMGWKDLKSLKRYKNVSFGVLPSAYSHFIGKKPEEIRRQINKARASHRKFFKTEAKIFSYPFGERSSAYKDIIKAAYFKAALGLQSGASYNGSDIFALPRFSMTETLGGIERFRLVANSLPLPVSDIEPNDPYHTKSVLNIGFSLPKSLKNEQLNCFISGQPNQPNIEVLGQRIELRPSVPLDNDRVRINCTMPVQKKNKNETTRWRWFGMLLVNAGK